ncbi:hypothetical protein M405DRAFT_407714 [Rhizopogon salebrosus TDB-379]|nr:hypothetical protein M405DRAFT_407714 [Rhizopogon salebrosus TDB-379]
MIDQSHNHLSLPLFSFSSHYHDFCMHFLRYLCVQNAMEYALDKKRYCGIQRDLRGPKRVSRYNFDPGCKMLIARLAALFTVWRSGQINIRNKSNRPNSRDEHRTQRTVLDQHALSTQAEGPVTTSDHSSLRPPLI